MSNHTDFYGTPLLISTWNLCLCHGHFPSSMEEKMLQVFPLLIHSTSQLWDRHSIFTFTFFFPTQGSIKLVFSICFVLAILYTPNYNFGANAKSNLLQKNVGSAEECRQRWYRKCLNLPSPQFEVVVHISEECQISKYRKTDYCLELNSHLPYEVMTKGLWEQPWLCWCLLRFYQLETNR